MVAEKHTSDTTLSSESNPDQQNTVDKSSQSHQPLPLPAPEEGTTTQLDASSGQPVKLDHLGPMVVNRDGTLSRIANWGEMSEIERQNTLRILVKRNQLRMDTLKKGEGEGAE